MSNLETAVLHESAYKIRDRLDGNSGPISAAVIDSAARILEKLVAENIELHSKLRRYNEKENSDNGSTGRR